jgi:hypothetical protein
MDYAAGMADTYPRRPGGLVLLVRAARRRRAEAEASQSERQAEHGAKVGAQQRRLAAILELSRHAPQHCAHACALQALVRQR